jgi:hypothetical protein
LVAMNKPRRHAQAWVHRDKHRYYQVYLEQEFFGDWLLRTVWGGIASRGGRIKSTGVGSYEDGLRAMREIEKRRAQRGHALMA